jgi:hypothetical protein
VRSRAFLKGLDREADCTLMLWKERSTKGRIYLRCRIVDEPWDLPEGPYKLSFSGHTVETRKFDGCWMLSFLPAGIDLEQAA